MIFIFFHRSGSELIPLEISGHENQGEQRSANIADSILSNAIQHTQVNEGHYVTNSNNGSFVIDNMPYSPRAPHEPSKLGFAVFAAIIELAQSTRGSQRKKNRKPLYEALQKIKEGSRRKNITEQKHPHSISRAFFSFPDISGTARRRLAEARVEEAEEVSTAHNCARKNKVPLLSVEALHHLHILIFVLAIVHLTFCVLTIAFGRAKIRQWKHWEDEIAKKNYESTVPKPKLTDVQQHEFIKD
ncbi:hypothetical protein L6164_002860 [Bauhinia variegata]|uniref:Uncharacterized protein n=1 Tax=Bauhinia variegata TaxID=167791 RepID=A0ACB9Q1M5_BAUVA|nr:hypothetical protein L6164_002860 [Bauhinia variegata]